jgi:hypothetical protein
MDEGGLSAISNACAEPDAMVVHFEDTAIAGGTMVGTLRFWSDAGWTPSEGIEGTLVLLVIVPKWAR